jgi:hypothetical protein
VSRQVEEVKVEPEEGAIQGERHSHPAFAQIGASRVSGSAVLYGADFRHQNFIRLRIAPSELKRSLSNDWPFERSRPYVEVDMSEAQWATFVSSMNMGSGVQCTLRYKDGEAIPELPAPTRRQDQFANEIKEKQAAALQRLGELADSLSESGLSARKLKPLLDLVSSAAMHVGSNTAYVAKQFGEHMERVTEAAKAEVNAYAMHLLNGASPNLRLGGDDIKRIEE